MQLGTSIEWKWLLWLLPFVLLIVILLLMRLNQRSRRINSSITERPNDNNDGTIHQTNPPMELHSTKVPTSRFKIISRSNIEDKETETLDFRAMVTNSNATQISMQELWSDSFVDSIYLTTDFIHSVDTYLDRHRIYPDAGVNIEIGGFLLGRYHIHTNNKCDVLIETLVPIKSEENHNLHLEFSTHSLSAELGDAQDQFPDLIVVGWFHTHPGHGLFLSKPDLAIQNGFFNEKFQFAMEIDSMTAALDLAFFTYKSSGEINNSAHQQKWLSWRQLQNTA